MISGLFVHAAARGCCAFVALALSGCVGMLNDHPGARGSVVDARTGRPLARAEIIAGGAYDSKILYTKSDGTFSVPLKRQFGAAIIGPALAPVDGNIFVKRPGYRTAHRKLRPIPPTDATPSPEDLGVIRLTPVSR